MERIGMRRPIKAGHIMLYTVDRVFVFALPVCFLQPALFIPSDFASLHIVSNIFETWLPPG
jgi:hypothetical protein